MKGSEAVNKYDEMRQRQQEEFNKLPIKFAYGNDQFKKMMQEFGLKENQTDKLYSLSSAGGYYLKTDAPKIKAWQKATTEELSNAIAEDTTGEGFILDMFYSELCNHEYGYTMDDEYTLDALGYTPKDIATNPALKRGLELAKQKILDEQSCDETMDMTM